LLRDVASQMIESSDIIAISEGVLLAGTWAWVLRVKRVWSGWREKAALSGFLCATISVVCNLVLTLVMHFRGDNPFAATLFVVAVVAGLLLGTAGIVLGFLGKGTLKVPALVWSCVVLLSVAITVVGSMMAMTR
jgi:hypothetical protein